MKSSLVMWVDYILYSFPPVNGRHGPSIQANVFYSEKCSAQQGITSEQKPLCYSAIQTDWWINTSQTKSLAQDCEIFFGPSPKGEGSAVHVSAAQFGSFYTSVAHSTGRQHTVSTRGQNTSRGAVCYSVKSSLFFLDIKKSLGCCLIESDVV